VAIETVDSNLIAEVKSILMLSFEGEDLQCKYRSSHQKKRAAIKYAVNLLSTKPSEALYAHGGNLNTGEWFKLLGLSDLWCSAILGHDKNGNNAGGKPVADAPQGGPNPPTPQYPLKRTCVGNSCTITFPDGFVLHGVPDNFGSLVQTNGNSM
jgi:hypothetical protein